MHGVDGLGGVAVGGVQSQGHGGVLASVAGDVVQAGAAAVVEEPEVGGFALPQQIEQRRGALWAHGDLRGALDLQGQPLLGAQPGH